ncbi:MAG: GEVED domain-containing protein, partial [Bacteroidales bacterium]|nr:GEVED domain-containing protein [Bacteroidales bacterium]
MKKNILFSAALMFLSLASSAQTAITFDSEDYKSITVYDKWEESPFRTGLLNGNAAVTENPDVKVDAVLGVAPNSTGKVVALQRSRFGSNAFGVRIDLKEPIRMTKQLQYIHVMAYLKDKPADSRMMVIGLGKRVEESWSWQTGEEEQFWAITNVNVAPKEGWQDVVVSFKGFSYSKEENADSGIDIYSLVIVPDVRSPHADNADWVAYFDEIVIDNNPDKRFSTDKYALTYGKDATRTRKDRSLNSVGLTSGGVNYTSAANTGMLYTDNTTSSVFSAKAGAQVQPTFQYAGNWMSAYVYVDWNNNGKFEYDINDNGTPAEGSEIVSYSAFQVNGTWYKSDGTTTANGNTIGGGVPSFTVPEGTPAGLYRMRYKVDWNNIDPAGGSTIISDGGGYVDLMLDVHGDKVSVSASQLNGDIVLASDESALQGYVTDYAQPLTVKDIPAPGFIQYGFDLKYGYNVNAAEQLDENGNPNWIEVNVPHNLIAADGTYTIPAEYIRGSQVSIKGDMQQAYKYTVTITGDNGEGGIVYAGKEYKSGDVIEVTQFFTAKDVVPIDIEGYTVEVSLDTKNNVIVVKYVKILEYRQVNSLSELRNDAAYHIKAKSGEGYFAWNTTISDTYISLRGLTNSSYNNLPSNQAVVNIYKEA